MKKNKLTAISILCIIILCSCAGQNNVYYYPVPDPDYFETESAVEIGHIIETGDAGMPDWLAAYISGGIEAVENLVSYRDKYVFIGINEGENFTVLSKWAENYAATHDFPMLAAARIERRMISPSALYPDDEYGRFFEMFVINAYNAEYPGAVKEAVYWIKTRIDMENNDGEPEDLSSSAEIYKFFMLICIDRTAMQRIVAAVMQESMAAVSPTAAQFDAISRLRQTFFEGF